METQLSERFGENLSALRAQYFNDQSPSFRLGAFLLTRTDRPIKPGTLLQAKELLHLATGCFDGDDQGPDILLTAILASSPEPERRLYRLTKAYRALKEVFFPSPHLIGAACALESRCRATEDFDNAARAARAVFMQLNAQEDGLGGGEIIPLCTLYALAGLTPKADDFSRCEQALSPRFRGRRALRGVAQLCVLYPEPETACHRTEALYTALRARGLRPGPAGVLGSLAGSEQAPEALARAIETTSLLLRSQSGTGPWNISSRERLALSVLLTALEESRVSTPHGSLDALDGALLCPKLLCG